MAKPFEDLRPPATLPPLEDVEWEFGHSLHSEQRATRWDASYMASVNTYSSLPELAARAQQATAEAVSYRNFNVGAALLVSDHETGRYGLFYGANLKPNPNAPKWCAEREALRKAQARGFKKAIALAVSGPLQPDADSGLVSDTLHPCGECRKEFRTNPLICPDTQILTVDDKGSAHELYTITELFRLHGSNFFDDRPSEEERYLE